jgi:hypothetical protein
MEISKYVSNVFNKTDKTKDETSERSALGITNGQIIDYGYHV